jgi:hypothetical protein
MSSSVAPLFPGTSVFIPAYWAGARSEILTQDEADLRYLKFPIGQGTENIPNLIVSGSSTLGITSATTPANPADNSTRVPTTNWVNTAITNAVPPPPTVIEITDTNTSSSFFPVFVSASGASQTLRADTSSTNALKYNPGTNTLFSSDGAVSSTLTVSSAYTGAGAGDSVLELESGNGTGMSINLSCFNSSNIYSVLRMVASQVDLYTGFLNGGQMRQPGIQFAGSTTDTYFATNTIGTSNYAISRINISGWTWGRGSVAGNYPDPPPVNITLDNLGAGLMALSTAGILSFGAVTNGLLNSVVTTAITPSATLAVTGNGLTFRSYNIIYTGVSTTVSAYTITTVPLNAQYIISIYNSGSGDVIFNGTAAGAGATRVGGGAGVNTFTIPTLRYAICKFKYINVNTFNMRFLDFTLM